MNDTPGEARQPLRFVPRTWDQLGETPAEHADPAPHPDQCDPRLCSQCAEAEYLAPPPIKPALPERVRGRCGRCGAPFHGRSECPWLPTAPELQP